MAKKEATGLVKKEWAQSFNLVGEAKINDFTFKLDEKSKKSDWVYNALNLGVDCGEKNGTVYCELMGGYGAERDNVIYCHGKKEDGSDDFENQYTIDWEERFDEDILKDIGDLCFLTVGLEKDAHEKTFYKNFLSAYDAIAYINEHLEDGMVVNVRGQLRYTLYNGNLQCRKEVNSIALSSATSDKYKAVFTQTMLLDKDSCTKDSLDKDKSVLLIDAYLLEKFKEFNGYDLTNNGKVKGGQLVPLRKTFEYEVDLTSDKGKENCKKVMTKLFKVKKDVTQITFEGEFIESGATVQATMDDVPDDIKELIEMDIYTEEEALAKCSENGNRERRMIIRKPQIKMVERDEVKTPVVQKFEERFSDEDLIMECLIPKDEDEELPFVDDDETTDEAEETEESEEAADDSEDWLNSL